MRPPVRADFRSRCTRRGACWSLVLFAIVAAGSYWLAPSSTRPPSRPKSPQEAVADEIPVDAASSLLPAAFNGTYEVTAASTAASAGT